MSMNQRDFLDDALSYKSTPDLPDDEGKALLAELNKLCGAIDFDDNGRKRRRDSYERQYAETVLRKAVLDASGRFSRHENFTAWLCRNNCEHIEGFDTLRISRDISNEVHLLRQRVEMLEDHMKSV